ncbi:hypothetical protein PFISCL1PPCAC_24395 [Pristionchus fissidentatus]|uniref:DUF3677 domain-containing protein n=1 Tax=Pristionchus fissidentatus TaxID=1538716 RepID=A0AAV5WR52_9BILA|nr:hypothetical protein PFISCL1PPCAC_24395 [Pristionchus fissidentatus]
MSNPLGKKVKKTVQPVTGGPLVEAIKPKPSITMIGQGMKRPITKPGPSPSSTPSSTSSSPSQPVKKPRLDFSSTATVATKPQQSTPQSTSHLRPPLDDTHKKFCASTEVVYDTFEASLDEACRSEKFNKAARLICAVLREVEKKKDSSGMVAFEENSMIAITKTVKEFGESLKHVNVFKSIFYLLCTTKGMQMDKQSLLVSWITHLNAVQSNADPVIITSYLHDALGERCWIDKPHSLDLATRVLRYFGTRFPTRSMYNSSGSDVSTPEFIPDESLTSLYFGSDEDDKLRKSTLDFLSRSWEFHGDSPPRHLLRTMNAFSGFPEVRLQAAKKIDGWLQNAKLQRVALEVLLFLGCNIGDASRNEMDRETLSHLLKLRSFKSKMVTPVYSVMLRELLSQNKENLQVIVFLLLSNEFGHPQHRYHLNMSLFHCLFNIDNKNTTKILGAEISSLMISREEHYKPARLFIRELVRSCLRTDFLFSNFAASFMERTAELSKGVDVKTLAFHVARVTVDTCTWLPLVAITQQIKDAFANRRANGSAAPSAMETINKFQAEMREYHRVVIQSLNALHVVISAPQMDMEFPKSFYKMLFLESPDTYSSLETGTADEIAQGIRVILECPINEKLICLIAKCDSMSRDDRLNLLDALLRNAIHTRLPSEAGNPLMNITTLNVFENLFKMAEYRDNGITLEPWFWKTWKICLYLLCATPPPPVFTTAYESYPILRMLCKMILLGNFSFPIKMDGKSANVIREEYDKQKQDELLIANLDSTADENVARLYCMINPPAVRPPPRPMAHELSQLAITYRMSAELSQLRSPDLLSKLIEDEGTSAAMPAIEAVIRLKSDSHSFIPIVCITQFLLHHLATDPEKKTVDDAIIVQMSSRLRDAVSLSVSTGGGEGEESLLLLLNRLASGQRNEREAAVALVTYLFHPEMDFPLLPQVFSLERLAASPIFDRIRSSACSSISSAFRVESDPSRLDLYIRFITKYARNDELHKLSTLLCHSSTRHDDSIRSSLIHFFARYVDNSSGEEKKKEEWPMVTMDVKGKKITLVSSTLFFILELLSRFRGGGEGRDRLLSLLLSPGGELPTVVNEEGETIELLNDQLRGAMLSSTDENIVRVALGRVDSLTAFNMICTFGLTTFSASNLLKNLDSLDESSLDEIPELRRALPFVIAYRKRGAEGGEKFLDLLTPPKETEAMKEEPMNDCDELILFPPPSFERSHNDLPTETPLLTKMELSKKLKEMVSTASFSLTSLEFRSAAVSEASSDVCLECLELNLKFFLSHVGAFNDMVQLLCAASDKYPSVKAKLRTLCAKVLKSAAVPPSIEDQIRKLAEGPVPVAAPKITVPTKKPLDLKCATAEDLLETLHKRKNMTNIERARLINRFVLLRPEIIDIRMTATEVDRQIGRVFGVQSREGLDRLVAQLWVRASPETIECILRRVLTQYNPSISSSAAMELLRHCASSPSYYQSLGKAELRVVCAYMMEKMTEEYPSNPSFVLQLTSFVNDRLIPITGFSILEDLAAHCVHIDRSTAPRERRVAASALLTELQKKFPRLHVSPSSSLVTIETGHNGISGADKEMTMLVGKLLDCKEDSDVASAIDLLTQTIHAHKEIVLRQVPVLSRVIARITESPAQQIKEHRRFRWIINFLITSMIDLLNDLPAKNIEDIDRLIDGLLEFHQRHVAGTRDEMDLSKRVLDLVLAYLRNQRTDAREFLQFVGGERVSGMIEMVRDETFDEIKRVIDMV